MYGKSDNSINGLSIEFTIILDWNQLLHDTKRKYCRKTRITPNNCYCKSRPTGTKLLVTIHRKTLMCILPDAKSNYIFYAFKNQQFPHLQP